MENNPVGPPALLATKNKTVPEMIRGGHSRSSGHRARQGAALAKVEARRGNGDAAPIGLGCPEPADRRRALEAFLGPQYALA